MHGSEMLQPPRPLWLGQAKGNDGLGEPPSLMGLRPKGRRRRESAPLLRNILTHARQATTSTSRTAFKGISRIFSLSAMKDLSKAFEKTFQRPFINAFLLALPWPSSS